ncbi:MAG: hypothetical protein LBD40_03340 [Puniceicoccales bacterium]|nr:hypothetical protein [Puniceicoccales bacterium]
MGRNEKRYVGRNGFSMLLVLGVAAVFMFWLIFMSVYLELVQERQKKRRVYDQLRLCAEYAMQDAFQHLQSTAAQDQRVTARANILDKEEEPVPADQGLWTGVWRTELEGIAQNTPQFCSWLISHTHDADGHCQDVTRENFCHETLVDGWTWPSEDSNSHGSIRTPFVNITDADGNIIGRYSYWIEDESQKACCTLTQAEAIEDEVLRSCPPQYGIDFLEGLSEFPQTSPRLASYETLKEIEAHHDDFYVASGTNPSIQNLSFYQHDLTCCSRGLLTDSRNAGFRKDLSSFFRHEDGKAGTYPSLTDEIFSILNNNDPEPAPTWGILKSFAQFGENVASQKISPQLASQSYTPIDYKDYSSWERSDLPMDELQIPKISPLMPIVTNASLLMRVRKTAWNSVTGSGTLAFDFIPQITLYNPHNVTLSSHGYRLSYRSLRTDGRSGTTLEPPAIRAILSLSGDTAGAKSETMTLGVENGSFWDVFSGVAHVELPAGGLVTLGLGGSTAYTDRNAGLTWSVGGKGAFTHDWHFALPVEATIDFSSYKLIVERSPSITSDSEQATNGWKHFYLFLQDQEGRLVQEVAKVQIEDSEPKSMEQTLSSVGETAVAIFGFSACLKSNRAEDYNGNNGVRWLAEGNPRAPWIGRSQIQDGEYVADNPMSPTLGDAKASNWHWSAQWLPTENLSGADYIAPVNEISGILFDIPRKNIGVLNLAFLQHANITPFGYHSAYAIGNSLQPPRVARELAFQKNSIGSVWSSHHKVEMLYDYSYCLNQALWDAYFLSTLRDGKPLNPRLQPWKVKENLDTIEDPWNAMASYLYIQGAFNVHSTSVVAWFAVLCSMYDKSQEKFCFCRFPEKSTGRVELSKDQLWSLAENIVKEIKKRGPFLGLSGFINRKLVAQSDSKAEQGLKGALQSAIDTTLHMNETKTTSSRNINNFDDEAASGDRRFGEPGYLTQADLLQSLGTFLTTRGDTFTIHVYAELLNFKGEKIRGICADVKAQRVPNAIDPSEPSKGRKFVLNPIRWSP